MQLLRKLYPTIPLLCLLLTTQLMASDSDLINLGQVPVKLAGLQSETNNSKAYQAALRGWEHYRLGAPEDYTKAISYYDQAIELDPEYARAYTALAAAHWAIASNGWSKSLNLLSSQSREQARLSLKKAMKQPFALTYQIASETAAYYHRRPDRALADAELAINLDADDPAGHLAMATALLKAKRAVEAEESVRMAMHLDPYFPASYLNRLGQIQFTMGQYQNAAETLETATNRNPEDDWAFVYLASTYGQLGHEEKAALAVKKANALRAKSGWGPLTINTVGYNRAGGGRRYYFKWIGDYKPLREGLSKAGVSRETWDSLINSETSVIEIKGSETIDLETAKILYERGVPFIDVHLNWMQGRIPGAYFLDTWAYEFTESRLSEIAGKSQEVVIYGSSTIHRWAAKSTARAVTWGYEKVYYFQDGFDKWKAAGYPVDTNKR
jgi:adenylate cyclase